MRYESTTGFSDEQVREIVRRVEQVLAGRPSWPVGLPRMFCVSELVVIALLLLRQNWTQEATADVYGVSQPTISRVKRGMVPLLDQVVCLHEPDPELVFANRIVLVDGSDVPTGNRKNTGKDNYSGKRHRQGLNIQVAASLDGALLAVSVPVQGCRHDRRALTETGWEQLLADYEWLADSAYQGTNATTPRRRTKTRDLTNHEKTVNRAISSRRAAVERAIGHLKNWKILSRGYRGRLKELPAIISIVTRLEFYRLGW